MIGEFIDSWELFHNAYVVGWLLAVTLSLVGVLVVARNQIFIGAAVAQASTLGIAVGMWGGALLTGMTIDPLHAHQPLSVMAVLFAVIAAVVTSRATRDGRNDEAVTGWVFLASASLSILILAHSPHGLEEIHHLLSSSIIGAVRSDVFLFAGLAIVSAVFVAVDHRRLLLFVMDPAMAAAVGMRSAFWAGLIACWLGLVVGLSMRATGLLYTFGCLVLPPLVASSLCNEARSMFLVAPLLALGVSAVAFVLANYYDYPPAQMAVALQSGTLVLAWSFRGVQGLRGVS